MLYDHEGSHLQAKKRGLEQIFPSLSSERTHPTNTLSPDFFRIVRE